MLSERRGEPVALKRELSESPETEKALPRERNGLLLASIADSFPPLLIASCDDS